MEQAKSNHSIWNAESFGIFKSNVMCVWVCVCVCVSIYIYIYIVYINAKSYFNESYSANYWQLPSN